jgi:hypothetical protein
MVFVPLPAPIAYIPATPAGEVAGELALRWKRAPRKAPEREVQLWTSTRKLEGTEGPSESVLTCDGTKVPLDVELYGSRLRIRGFDDGGMRYTLLGMTDGLPSRSCSAANPSQITIFSWPGMPASGKALRSEDAVRGAR